MPTEVVRTVGVGQTYTTLTAWEAAYGGTSGNLVSADQTAVAEIVGDVVCSFNDVDFSGWTTDATRRIVLRPKSGSEIDPVALTGANLTSGAGDQFGFVFRSGHYVTVERLGLKLTPSSDFIWSGSQGGQIFDSCVIYDTTTADVNSKAEFRNCLIIASTSVAGEGCGNLKNAVTKNCTVINKSGKGAFSGDIGLQDGTHTNTVIYNANTKATFNSFQTPTSITALGGSNVDGIVTTDFDDYTNADFNLPSGSALINVATDLSSTFTKDINQVTRSSWDIGAFEFVSGGGGTFKPYWALNRSSIINSGVS
jgi:hypothetical protein